MREDDFTVYLEDDNGFNIDLEDDNHFELELLTDPHVGPISNILYDTTANWAAKPELIGVRGYLYVYSDYQQDGYGKDIPGIKVGDGNAYLIDLPFIDKLYAEHILDKVSHITEEEREAWNNKVTCYIDPENNKRLIFSKK